MSLSLRLPSWAVELVVKMVQQKDVVGQSHWGHLYGASEESPKPGLEE
jgi:hypothetical protein